MKPASIVSTLTPTVVMATSALAGQLAAADPRTSAAEEGDKAPKAGAPTAAEDYRLGPGDKLRIEVYKDQQLSQSVQIRPDGKITLPLVGDLDATGRTPIELRDSITQQLRPTLPTRA